jgi:hypothetical protein
MIEAHDESLDRSGNVLQLDCPQRLELQIHTLDVMTDHSRNAEAARWTDRLQPGRCHRPTCSKPGAGWALPTGNAYIAASAAAADN